MLPQNPTFFLTAMCRTQLPSPCAEGRCRFIGDTTHEPIPQMLRTTVATNVPKLGLHLSTVRMPLRPLSAL